MIDFFLVAGGGMTVEAGDAFAGVRAHLKFVDNCRRLLSMAFRTLAHGASKRGGRLDDLDQRAATFHEKGCDYERCGNHDGNEDPTK
jgi:hypothetical protein